MSHPQLERLAAYSAVPPFLPIDPALSSKGPVYDDWPNNTKTLSQALRYLNAYGVGGEKYGVGVLLGPRTNLVDLEGDGPQAEASRRKLLGCDCPTLAFLGKRGRHAFHPYNPRLAHLPSKFTHPDYPDLEFRGFGISAVQSVIPPTPPRKWENDLPIAPLPEQAIERLLALVEPPKPSDPWDDLTKPATVDRGKVWEALAQLKPSRADSYDDWFKIGAALHSLGNDYFALFDAWSSQSPKYGGRQSTSDLWGSLKPGKITIGTLFHLAKQDRGEPRPEVKDDGDPTSYFGLLTSAELDDGDFAESWLIDDVLVEGQPAVVGGPEKTLKTSIICEAAVSLSSGKPFLGRFNVLKRGPTLVMTAESGLSAIQGTMRRVAKAKGVIARELDVIWSPRLPQLDQERDLGYLERAIKKYGAKLVEVDPAYLCLGGDDHGDVFKTGPLLRRVAEVVNGAGATILMAHHTHKGASAPSDRPIRLTDLSQAGWREWAGTWWLLNRRSDYRAGMPHELWLSAGSRSGDTYDFALDIFEGSRKDPGGKVWRIDRIIERHKLKEETAKRELQQAIEGVVTFLEQFPAGRALTPIAEAIELSADKAQAILDHMVSLGLVEAGQVPHPQSATKTIPGYRLWQQGREAA